jgi:3',5'-cyclic-AMP phosphodiesterase
MNVLMKRRTILKNLGLAAFVTSPDLLDAKLDLKEKSIRVAHITDVHVQPFIGAAKGFEKCLHHIQSLKIKPDLILNGGDCIMGAKNANIKQITRQFELFNSIISSENQLPYNACMGNHDVWYGADFEGEKRRALDQIGLDIPYYSIDKGTWKIIVLDSVQKHTNKKKYTAQIDEQQLEWLKNELQNTPEETHIMIMSHVPILSACVFFDGKNFNNHSWQVSGSWMHSDAQDLIELFYKHKNVKLAISGHIHLLDKVEYNGVTYCCNGAVSGAWWMGKYKQTPPGYAVIDLHADGQFDVNYVNYKA